MISNELTARVAHFLDLEEHSCSPILLTPENVAKQCYITVEEATAALKALGR